jgi:hypothetical protein
VRDLKTFTIASINKGFEQIKLPANFNLKEWEVISFLQSSSTGVITAAERVKIDPVNVAVQNPMTIKQVQQ